MDADLGKNARESNATQQQMIDHRERKPSTLSPFWMQPLSDDPAVEAVVFHGRCDAAAWRIQESFRSRHKRRSSKQKDKTPPDEAKQIQKLDHEDTDDSTAGSSPSSTPELDEQPDKPQIDRSALYTAILVLLFSCSMFIFRQINKFCGRSTEGEEEDLGVTQELGDNAMDAVGTHVVREGVINSVSGGAGGGGGGGGAAGNPAAQGMATQAASSAASAGAAGVAAGAAAGAVAAGAVAQVGILAAITSSAPAAAASAAMVSVKFPMDYC
jgi:hypothetical protein